MKQYFLLTLITLFTVEVFSQINVTGKIVDDKKIPIIGATITYSNDKEEGGSITNEEGIFSLALNNLGKYKIKISFVGYLPITQEHDFQKFKSYDLGVTTLHEDVKQLQSLEVIGRLKRDYNSDYSFSATKIAVANKELPQAISSVTKELIADRQAFHLADAVKKL